MNKFIAWLMIIIPVSTGLTVLFIKFGFALIKGGAILAGLVIGCFVVAYGLSYLLQH